MVPSSKDRTPASQAGNMGSSPIGITIYTRVAERKTRRIKGPVSEKMCGFESHHVYHTWVSRLAAMAARCKRAGKSCVGSSPTWPTKVQARVSGNTAMYPDALAFLCRAIMSLLSDSKEFILESNSRSQNYVKGWIK